jgi:predicted GIY-YIG superfamily endonuclease
VAQRLQEHNSGKTKSLAHVLPVKLVFAQEFDNEITARRTEYQLKQKKSRVIIEKIIQEGKIKFLGP